MTTYKLVMPEDMNHYGFLFGGKMLMWIDEVAWIDFNDKIAVQRHDVEEQVDVLCLTADFDRVFPAKKRDTFAKRQQR